jgi:hypothetical protein
MKRWHWAAILFILSIPILMIRAITRFVRHIMFLRLAVQTAIICRTCRSTIPLLGMWKCACGAVAEGHLLHPCGVCGSSPTMIRCYKCSATRPVRR